MKSKPVIEKFKISKRGVVIVIDVTHDKILFGMNHHIQGEPILFIRKNNTDEMITIETAASFDNMIYSAFFTSNEDICYKTRNDQNGFDYFYYDLKNLNRKLLKSTANAAIANLPYFKDKIIVTDPSPVLLDVVRGTGDMDIMFPSVYSQNDVNNAGSVALFDETHLAMAGVKTGTVFITNCETGNVKYILRGPFESLNPQFASNNYYVGFGNDMKGVFLWSKSDGEPVQGKYFHKTDVEVSCGAISSNEKIIAFANWNGEVKIIDITTDSVLFSKKVYPGRIMSICFSFDDSQVFIGGEKADFMILKF